MPRIARVVVPGICYHVTQRGQCSSMCRSAVCREQFSKGGISKTGRGLSLVERLSHVQGVYIAMRRILLPQPREDQKKRK